MSSTQAKIQPSARLTPRFLNSIGIKLFASVMLGAIAGLGIVTFFFYRTLEEQSILEIQGNLDVRVKEIDSELAQGEQFVLSMANAAQFLHNNKAGSADDYKRLMFSLMAVRPKLVTGFGVLQTPKGLIGDRQWFGPYIVEYKAQAVEQVKRGIAERLAFPHQEFAYQETTITDEYFKQDYYNEPVKVGKNYWVEPYTTEVYSVPLTTFAGPIKDSQGKLIAVFNGDISLQDLVAAFKDRSVFKQSGYYVLLSADGKLLAYPPHPEKAKGEEDLASIPELKDISSEAPKDWLNAKSGLLRSQKTSSYWAYQKIPRTGWVMLAKVPYEAVSGRALQITIGGTLLAATILAIVAALFTRQMNKRLQPILEECGKLAATDAETQSAIQKQDEIGQLSISFFNLLKQLGANEEQLRQEVALTQQTQKQVQDQASQIEADSQALQEDVGHLLEAVSAVEDGDLTVQAPVSDRVTGLVSDTLNRLIEQLAQVLAQVSNTAQQVTQTSQQLDTSAKTVALNVQQQANEVVTVLNLTERVQDSARHSTSQIDLANQSLQQVQGTVAQGQTAIDSLTKGIQTLQSGAERIVQRTEDLDGFVTLTDQFVQEQSQLAELIQSLAMGATLLSARATAQQDPRQMMVLAKEFETIASQIKNLAEQTNQNIRILEKRTDRIKDTVTSINQDLQGIGALVGNFTKEVRKSTQVFGSIQSATESAIATGENVSQSSQQIVQTAQATAKAMDDIARLANQTATLTQTAQKQSEQMQRVSQQLLQRIQFFRLPADASDRADLSQEVEEGTIDITPTTAAT